MRPIELEIAGLTAFRDPQTIDFSSLGLFAITGPTGAGKTSVLDAMTLALYGLVARGGKHDVRSLITLGRSEAKVRLDFAVDSARYRVARRFRRATQSAALERFEVDRWVPDVEQAGVRAVNDRIEALIGLDFDAFTRAVLLPQGDFHRFLKGKPDERKSILERLLDLGRYKAAGKRAGEIKDGLQHEVRVLEDQLQTAYAEVTPERQEELEASFGEAQERAERFEELDLRATAVFGSIAEVEALLDRLRSLRADLGPIEQNRSQLERSRAELEPRRLEVQARLAGASLTLEAALEAEQSATQNLRDVVARVGDEGSLVRLEAVAGTLSSAILEADRRRGELERVCAAIDELTSRRGDLCEQVERLKSERDASLEWQAAARERLQTARRAAGQAEALQRALADVARLDDELRGVRESLGSLTVERQQLTEYLERAAAEVAAARVARETAAGALLAAEETQRLAGEAERKRSERTAAEEALGAASHTLEGALEVERAAHRALADARAELQVLEHANHAAVLRATLKPAAPCPVCEHPVGEIPPPIEAVEASLESAREAVAGAERAQADARRTVDTGRFAVATARERLSAIEAALAGIGTVPSAEAARSARDDAQGAAHRASDGLGKAEKEHAELRLALERARTTHEQREGSLQKLERDHREAWERADAARQVLSELFPDDVPDDVPAVQQAAERAADEADRSLDEVRSQLTDAEARLGRIETSLEERQTLRSRVEEEARSWEEQARQAHETLSAAFPDGLPDAPAGEIQARLTRLTEAWSAAERAREELDSSRRGLQKLQDQQEQLAENDARLATATADLAGQLRRLAGELVNAGLADVPAPESDATLVRLQEVIHGLRSALDGALEERERESSELRAALAGLAAEATGRELDGEPWLLREELARALQEARRAVISGEHAVSAFEKQLSEVARTRERVAELQTKAQLHHRLWRDLRSDHFLKFVLGESFEDLAAAASIELRRISGGRYSLTADGSDFAVVDHENADETRSVVTLSGGETFLASLSLALSLASAVQDLAGTAAASRLEAIFIDEGFGALDPGALETVINALERLQQGNRMVGVITHVPELATRIPAALEVQPGGAGIGSRVSVRR